MIEIPAFRKKIKDFAAAEGRDLPWRRTRDPYRILVSEIMLQQTQVERVRTFYEKFIKQFPDLRSLARSRQHDVLAAWQGLGYNRRALALREAARIVVRDHGGVLPRDRAALESLPGIGPYTAGALRAFIWGEPEIFIETNIRRAFIHFFFPRRNPVRDAELLPLIERSLDRKDPRAWYFALMDYGAMLGVSAPRNPNRRSAHHVRQSKFAGSDREIRGKILRLALAKGRISRVDLERTIPRSKARIARAADALVREGFLRERNNSLFS